MTTTMLNVMFVCLGNICRSPMAEAVFKHMVAEAGLSNNFYIESSGTGGFHIGEHACAGTLDVLKRRGIRYNGRAQQLSRYDIDRFDYVLAMDRGNFKDVLRYVPQSQRSQTTPTTVTLSDGREISLFLRHAYEAGTVNVLDVPDPYYEGGFEHVYDLVSKGAAAFLDYVRRTQQV